MPLLLGEKLRGTNNNGTPISGCKAYTYQEGTTTPVTTYSDRALSTAQAHPVVGDSNGYVADIFVPAGTYKLRLTDASDNVLWEIDSITVIDVTISEYAETLLDDTTATAARDTLGLGALAVLDADAAARTALGLEIGADILGWGLAGEVKDLVMRDTSPVLSMIESAASTQRTTITHDTGDLIIATVDPVSTSPSYTVTLGDGGPAQPVFSATLALTEMFSTGAISAVVGPSYGTESASYVLDDDGLSVSISASNPGPVQGSAMTIHGAFNTGGEVYDGFGSAALFIQHTSGASGLITISAAGRIMIGSNDEEVYAQDGSKNQTLLSPHNFDYIPGGASEPMAWSYFSMREDQYIATDLCRWGRILEELTGEKLVYIGSMVSETEQAVPPSGTIPDLLARIEALEAAVAALQGQ